MDNRLRIIVSTVLNIPPASVEPDLRRESLAEWDSLNHLRLISAFEEEFGVQLSTSEIVNISSVREFEQLLEHGDRAHA